MKYIKVNKWEEFQHYKNRRPPWIKLYTHLLDDYEFGCLHDASKLLAIYLWMLAAKHDNKIPYDITWLKRFMTIKFSESNIKDLEIHGFIECYQDASKTLASCKQDASPSRDREETYKTLETEKRAVASSSNEQFIQSLKDNPAYEGINIDTELGKMDSWLSARPGRKKTRKFVVNWLNRVEKPMGGGNGKAKSIVDEWAEEQGVNLYSNDGERTEDIRISIPQIQAHKGNS